MVVACEKCGARYKLDESRISGRGAKITCPRCRNVFVVVRDGAASAATSPPKVQDHAPAAPQRVPPPSVASATIPAASATIPAASATIPAASATIPAASATGTTLAAKGPEAAGPALTRSHALPPREPTRPPPPRTPLPSADAVHMAQYDVNKLDFRKVGLKSWKVKVKIGLVYDFSDYRTLSKYIQEGRVTPTDLISHNGLDWTPLGDIADLKGHFVAVYRDAERQMQEEPDEPEGPDDDAVPDGFEDDQPTSIMGMGDLDAVAAAALAAEEDEEIAQARAVGGGGRLAAPATTGGQGNADASPRFVDPFESLQAKRQTKGRGRRIDPTAEFAPPPKPTPAATGGSSRGLLVAVGLLVMVALGAWAFWPSESSNSNPQPKPVAHKKATEPKAPSAPPSRAALQKDLVSSGTPIEPEEDASWGVEYEPELIPVIPKEVARGTWRPPGSSSMVPEQGAAVASPVSSSASDHTEVAEEAARRGDWSSAASAYRNAVAADPGNAKSHERLGYCLYRAGDTTGAIGELKQASAAGRVQADRWLGDIYRDMGDSAGALGHYATYLDSHPSDADVLREVEKLKGS